MDVVTMYLRHKQSKIVTNIGKVFITGTNFSIFNKTTGNSKRSCIRKKSSTTARYVKFLEICSLFIINNIKPENLKYHALTLQIRGFIWKQLASVF